MIPEISNTAAGTFGAFEDRALNCNGIMYLVFLVRAQIDAAELQLADSADIGAAPVQ